MMLQPTNSDLDFATSSPSLSSTSTTSSVSTVNPDYDFGFRVGLGYVFPDSGNDVQASWTHFDNSYNDNSDYGQGTTIVTKNGRSDTLFAGETADASSNANFRYDAIDLDIGQYLSVGTRLTTRLFAGLRYAHIQ